MTDGTLEASSEEYEECWDTMSDGDSLFGDLGECDSDSSKNPRANTESHDVIDLTNDDDEDITDGFISTLPAPSWLSTGVDITSIRSDITQSTGSYIGSYVNTSLPDNPLQISDVELDLHLSSLLLTSGFPFETQALLPYLGSSSEVEGSVNHRSNGQMFRPISNGSQDHMNGTIPVPTVIPYPAFDFNFNAMTQSTGPEPYVNIGSFGQPGPSRHVVGSTMKPVIGVNAMPYIAVPTSKPRTSSRPDFAMATLNRRGAASSSASRNRRAMVPGQVSKPARQRPASQSLRAQTPPVMSPPGASGIPPSTPRKSTSYQPRSNSATPTSFRTAFERSKKVVQAFKVQKAQQREAMGIELIGIDTPEGVGHDRQSGQQTNATMVTASQNGDLRADELIRELEKLVAAAGASTSAIAGNEMGTMFMEDDGKLPNWNDDISSSLALSIEQLLSMALPPVPPLENMPVSASPLEPNPVVASQPAPNPLALQPNPVSVEVTDLLPMSLPLELAFSQSTVSDATTAAIMDDGANSYGGSLTIDLGSAGEFGDVGNALSMVDDWLNTSMSTDTAGWNFMTLEDCLESSLVLPDVGGSGKRKADDDEVSRIKSFEESVAEPRTVKRMRLINE